MDDIQIPSSPAETGATKAVSQISESLTHAAESHRALVQDMTEFAKDESLRFTSLRLARNGAALNKLQTFAGLPGLFHMQQEWLRDFLQDYAAQNLRVAGAFRGLARNMVASVAEVGSENLDGLQHEAGEMVHQTAEASSDVMDHMQHEASNMAHRSGEQMGQMTQEANTYIQH